MEVGMDHDGRSGGGVVLLCSSQRSGALVMEVVSCDPGRTVWMIGNWTQLHDT